jgi:hypothetical protein
VGRSKGSPALQPLLISAVPLSVAYTIHRSLFIRRSGRSACHIRDRGGIERNELRGIALCHKTETDEHGWLTKPIKSDILAIS